MNTQLLAKAKSALNNDRPQVRGYKNLSLSDIELVVMCAEEGIPLRYATPETVRLYNDIIG